MSDAAKLTMKIYFLDKFNNNITDITKTILLNLLSGELKKSFPQEGKDSYEENIDKSVYTLAINFSENFDKLPNILDTGLSFLYHGKTEKKGIELDLNGKTNLQIQQNEEGNGKILYQSNDVNSFEITNDRILYQTNSTNDKDSNVLHIEYNDGVTMKYKVNDNVYTYAFLTSIDREYPIMTIEGDIPETFQVLDYDKSSALERLDRIPFGEEGYRYIFSSGPEPAPKKKILCLHGGGEEMTSFRSQQGVQDLINALPDYEFLFAQSPLEGNIWWHDPQDKQEGTTDVNHASAFLIIWMILLQQWTILCYVGIFARWCSCYGI